MNKVFVAVCEDYHEFDQIRGHLNLAGVEYRFEQVGCGVSECGTGYDAIFWQDGIYYPNIVPDFAQDVIKKLKAILKLQSEAV